MERGLRRSPRDCLFEGFRRYVRHFLLECCAILRGGSKSISYHEFTTAIKPSEKSPPSETTYSTHESVRRPIE